jgi:hypothetical protein
MTQRRKEARWLAVEFYPMSHLYLGVVCALLVAAIVLGLKGLI